MEAKDCLRAKEDAEDALVVEYITGNEIHTDVMQGPMSLRICDKYEPGLRNN